MTIRTESVPNCPLCSREGRLKYEGLSDRLYGVPGRWNFMSCRECGVLWLNPCPVPEDITKCYPERYFTHEAVEPLTLGRSGKARRLRSAVLHRQFGYHHLDVAEHWLALLGRILMLTPWLRRKLTMGLDVFLIPYQPDGRLLDIGCGNGVYLALMKQLGWEVMGIEMDAKAAAIAQSHFGFFVHVGTVNDAPFDERSFDVVTMSHVLEHVRDPIKFLQTAARFLKPGGRIIIVTPNAQSLGSLLFRKDWYALDPPRHLVLFTPKSVKKCLAKVNALESIKVFTSVRKSRKIFRKGLLARVKGRFLDDSEV
jgi:2-polyprenyl-3-methyl-5-hydroxy-6-metoxy-1,4-benzoquinol methylase